MLNCFVFAGHLTRDSSMLNPVTVMPAPSQLDEFLSILYFIFMDILDLKDNWPFNALAIFHKMPLLKLNPNIRTLSKHGVSDGEVLILTWINSGIKCSASDLTFLNRRYVWLRTLALRLLMKFLPLFLPWR